MIKWSKLILPTVLAISLVAPISAYAHGGGKFGGQTRGSHEGGKRVHQQQKQAPSTFSNKAQTGPHGHGKHKDGFASVKKATFFTLLVEKYSPDTLSNWEATLAEAKKLRTDIQTIVKANPELKATLKSQHTEDLKTKMEENKATRDAFKAALEAKDSQKITASLAAILTKLQNRNKLMAAKLTALQTAVAAKTPASTPTTP